MAYSLAELQYVKERFCQRYHVREMLCSSTVRANSTYETHSIVAVATAVFPVTLVAKVTGKSVIVINGSFLIHKHIKIKTNG